MLSDRDFDQKLPIRTFPAHYAIDELQRRQVCNRVIAPPYQPHYALRVTRTRLSFRLPLARKGAMSAMHRAPKPAFVLTASPFKLRCDDVRILRAHVRSPNTIADYTTSQERNDSHQWCSLAVANRLRNASTSGVE